MNHSNSNVPPELAEQQYPPTAAAAAGSGNSGGAPTSSNSGSPSWPPAPPPPSTSNGSSFFQQMFADADDDTSVVVDAGDTAAASSYVDDLLLPPASADAGAVFNDAGDHVFQLGAFPMDSFICREDVSGPEALGLRGEQTTVSGRPHTLEFVNPLFSTSCNSLLQDSVRTSADHQYSLITEPHNQFSKRSPRTLHQTDDDDHHRANLHAAKKAKVHELQADGQCTPRSVDPSHLQSIINKVSQSQSASASARSKEKLGERINALQQLVSPFGKTDTASVLSEAIGYIKFLQEQVQVLSSPYMKPCSTLTSTSFQDGAGAEAASDLRSRGLCLVPVSCTTTVANNNNFNIGADYWASTPNLSSTTGNGANTTRFSASS